MSKLIIINSSTDQQDNFQIAWAICGSVSAITFTFSRSSNSSKSTKTRVSASKRTN
ncbi:unknown [Pasteurella phage F108]|uniref:Uncharacterized protein n=1 Tax=Pasteurella phage F108 TaxID=2911430 RepID=Q1I115_9CAUD|nr:hypothetical protein F108p05 [Pasteurella phage F108]ABD49442.1 unknown [Pasteurella phage F108]